MATLKMAPLARSAERRVKRAMDQTLVARVQMAFHSVRLSVFNALLTSSLRGILVKAVVLIA